MGQQQRQALGETLGRSQMEAGGGQEVAATQVHPPPPVPPVVSPVGGDIRGLPHGVQLGGTRCLAGGERSHAPHVPLLHRFQQLLVLLVPAFHLE